eukprot:1757818-Rhodomonas_salina.1
MVLVIAGVPVKLHRPTLRDGPDWFSKNQLAKLPHAKVLVGREADVPQTQFLEPCAGRLSGECLHWTYANEINNSELPAAVLRSDVPRHSQSMNTFACAVYGISMVFLFSCSTAHHAVHRPASHEIQDL